MKAREQLQDAMVEIGAIGASETMKAAQAQLGLRSLNRMIDGWQSKRLLVYAVTEVVANVTGATATIGTGHIFDTPLPARLERGCYFVSGSQSYPIQVWDRESYNNQTLKGQSGQTQGVYLDRAAGVVKFWPVPSAAEIHLQVLNRLSSFADLDTDYAVPDGYQEAIYQTLLERLPSLFGLPVGQGVPQRAASARRALRRVNADIPTLQTESSGGRYNVLTNQ
jgi:hypothetical protein